MTQDEPIATETQTVYCGIHARYHGRDARWFATISFATMLMAYIAMAGSSISYLGLTFDIGTLIGLGPFVLTESMIMIPIHFLVSMLFFAGGIEWYVLCRHCPCYEHSGKEHGNDKRFYCLANWGSPKLFKYDPSPVSRAGQAIFLIWGIGYAFLFPLIYLWDRLDWLLAYLIVTFAFLATLRHWACSSCPNFGCPLNHVPSENREEFMKKLESGEIYT
ncbi:MAG: hypothetical protein JSW61_02730 [Candidatus Thorarchaeota archaeon]|nr:MAG: hypothetical protein JSW61_02730 [Candidatus Thorarchaeota archaeon]